MRLTAAAISESAPQSGIRPIFAAATAKYDDSDTNVISQASASDAPRPTDGPFTAATTGRGSATIARTARLAASMRSAGGREKAVARSSALISLVGASDDATYRPADSAGQPRSGGA
jgi:hypothetical protein